MEIMECKHKVSDIRDPRGFLVESPHFIWEAAEAQCLGISPKSDNGRTGTSHPEERFPPYSSFSQDLSQGSCLASNSNLGELRTI